MSPISCLLATVGLRYRWKSRTSASSVISPASTNSTLPITVNRFARNAR